MSKSGQRNGDSLVLETLLGNGKWGTGSYTRSRGALCNPGGSGKWVANQSPVSVDTKELDSAPRGKQARLDEGRGRQYRKLSKVTVTAWKPSTSVT